jgi:hypothetical protein
MSYIPADTAWYANNCVTTKHLEYSDIYYTNPIPCAGTGSNYYTSPITAEGTVASSYDSNLINSWLNPGIKYTFGPDYGVLGTGDYTTVTPTYYNPYNISGTISNNWYSYDSIKWSTHEESATFKNAIFLQKLKSNLTIAIKSRADLPNTSDPAERTAMETLRESISETEFRKYLRYGFVLVKGKSGDTFQIFRNRSHTKVWRNGKVIEEVCVRIHYDQKVPPTDNVIAFRSIIQADEESFRKLGNVFKMGVRVAA